MAAVQGFQRTASRMVRLPPNDPTDAAGWTRALLTDLAGWPECSAELLEAAWDVQASRLSEWSMNYNVYGIEMHPSGARVDFIDESCPVPFEVLEAVLGERLGL